MISAAQQRLWTVAGAVSVRTKIMGIVISVILVLGAAITIHLVQNSYSTLRHQSEEKGAAIARGMAARSSDLVLTNRRYSLYSLAQEVRASDPDVLYVYVTDPSGTPIVHTFGDQGFPQGLLSLPAPDPAADYVGIRLSTDWGPVRDVAVPILAGRGGFAHIGISEQSIDDFVVSSIRANLIVIAVVLVTGGFGAYILATVLTRPVSHIVEATEAVGQGDFSQRARVWARDEIGRLAMAFNRMTDQLARSRSELLQRNRELAALNDVATATGRTLDVRDVAATGLAAVLRWLGLEAGWVMTFDEGRRRLSVVSSQNLPDRWLLAEVDVDPVACGCARALTTDEPVEITGDGECPHVASLPTAGVPVLATALRSKGRAIGLLNVVWQRTEPPAPDERRMLAAVGDQIGVALENALLWQELQRKEEVRSHLLEKVITAQEEERKRIARELHDETGQVLTSLTVGLRSLEEAESPETLRDLVRELRARTAAALETVHDLAFELRPSVLDDGGLVPALRRYVADYSRKYGIEVDLQTTAGAKLRLSPPVETALYRIVQEAMSNVARHSGATQVSVLVERRHGAVVLVIEDDGTGFDAQAAMLDTSDKTLGLHGMQERASLVGGRLTIESGDSGTAVFVEVPLPDAPEQT